MIISHSRKFIFVHVPKTAGTSIVDALMPHTFSVAGHLICRALRLVGHSAAAHHYSRLPGGLDLHATAAEIRAALGPRFDSLFSFAFVRNPWDWRVSIYHYVLQKPSNPWHDFIKALGSFGAYIEHLGAEGANDKLSAHLVDGSGQVLVDFVGRFERLDQDFAHICQQIGVTPQPLPHLKQSKRQDYRAYYTERTAAIIAQRHAGDIERFGYTF